MEMNWLFLKRLPKFKFQFQFQLTRKMVEDGKRRPKGYGFAWRDFDTSCTISYPIPFNVLFRGLRRLWHWIVGGYKNSVIDEARIKGIREGQELTRLMRNQMVPPTKRDVLRWMKEADTLKDRRRIKIMYYNLLYGNEKE